MRRKNFISVILIGLLMLGGNLSAAFAQSGGTLRGTITLEPAGTPAHNVIVTITQLKRSVETDDNGVYEFTNVPPGTYDVVAELDRVPSVISRATVTAGGTATADFQIRLTTRGEEVT